RGVVVVNVTALLGGDLDVLGALALVGHLVGHRVYVLFVGDVGGPFEPRGAVALKGVAVHLLAEARQQAGGDQQRGQRGHTDPNRPRGHWRTSHGFVPPRMTAGRAGPAAPSFGAGGRPIANASVTGKSKPGCRPLTNGSNGRPGGPCAKP